jgi:hypothetical protein
MDLAKEGQSQGDLAGSERTAGQPVLERRNKADNRTEGDGGMFILPDSSL